MKTVCIDRDLTATTAALLEKYGHRRPADGTWSVAAGRVRPLPRGMTLLPGWALEESTAPEGAVPLLPIILGYTAYSYYALWNAPEHDAYH